MLKPGGTIGIVDFCVPMASAIKVRALQSIESAFWKRWFSHDGVRLDPDHRAMLRQLFPQNEIIERRARVPYLPAAMVPYYLFVGKKPLTN